MGFEFVPSKSELTGIHMVYLALGAFITVFGLASFKIKDRLFLSEAFVATLFGVVIGPIALGLLENSMFGDRIDQLTLEISRVVLAIQCFTAGIEAPTTFVKKESKSLVMLLGPVLLFMFGISTIVISYVFNLGWREGMIIAACITPTDPILANAIVKGSFADEHVPRNLRYLISTESGANDGIGLPLLFLPFYLTAYDSYAKGFGWWVLIILVYQVLGAIVLGIVFGVLFRKLLKQASYNNWMDKESFLALSVASALMCVGFFARLGMDEFVGCFTVGLVVSWDRWLNDQLEGSHIQEVLDSLLNITYFIFFGSRIPWSSYGTMESLAIWRLVVGCGTILLFRRLPIVLAIWKWIPGLNSWEEAVFAGWFGPIGAGAIYYAMLSIVAMKEPAQPLFGIVSAMVISSVLIHCGSVGLFHIGLVRARTLEQRQAFENSIVVMSNPVMQSNTTISSTVPIRTDCQQINE